MLYSGSLHIGTCPCDDCNSGTSKCDNTDCEQIALDEELEANDGLCNRCHFGECAECGDVLVDGHVMDGEGKYAEPMCKDCFLIEQALPKDDGGSPAILEVKA